MPSPDPVAAPVWGPAAPEEAADSPAWQQQNARKRGRWTDYVPYVAAGIALLAGWAAVVWVALWYHPPRPVSIVAVGAGYELNLSVPHNVYGWRTAERLSSDASESVHLVGPPQRLRIGDDWDRDLPAADGQTVILYLAMHGATDEKGPYLLRDDADLKPGDAGKLRIADVIARLGKLPASRNKIVFLDATQPPADPNRGVLRNDFARGLAALEADIEAVPNLIVISSSAPDQRSWPSPEYGETVFGYYLRRGLAGDVRDENGDSVIRANELFNGTATLVEQWSRANRGDLQQIVLLPSGNSGTSRASRMILGPVRPPRPQPEISPPAPLTPEVGEMWKMVGTLLATSPPPQTYAPLTWRTYLDTVLRYEALVEAGDSDSAGRLLVKTTTLSASIRAAGATSIGSCGNSISGPYLAGLQAEPTEAARQAGDALAKASASDLPKLWQTLSAPTASDPHRATEFVLQVAAVTLDHAARDPIFLRNSADAILATLFGPERVAPIEAHYARMMLRDLPDPTPPGELLSLALRTRISAGQVAYGARTTGPAYSERVEPFSRSAVQNAEPLRLAAQDLLFSGDATRWADARKYLADAGNFYTTAAGRTESAAAGFTARDRAFSELTYYGLWIGLRTRPDDPAERDRLNSIATMVESLWTEAHDLDTSLRAAAVAPTPQDAVATIQKKAADLTTQLDTLRREFLGQCERMASVDLPGVWRDSGDALSVPFLPADERLRLLENKRRISYEFLTRSIGENPAPILEKSVASRSADAARRQGRMALARLGSEWYAALGAKDAQTYDVVGFRIRSAADGDAGWQTLLDAGAQIASHSLALPAAIDEQRTKALDLPGDGPLGPRATADAYVRILPAAAGPQIVGDPASDCRAAWLSRLLTQLAQRTWEEHWFAYDPADQPYYRRAGGQFLNDAQLAGDPIAIRNVQNLLNQPGTLKVTFDPAAVTATTQIAFPVRGKLEVTTGAAIPNGRAVWSGVAGTGLALPKGSVAEPVGVGDTPETFVANLTNANLTQNEAAPPDSPAAVPTSMQVNALYRGQRIRATVPVGVYPRPGITVNDFPKPSLASIALRADPALLAKYGNATGTVVFVLDCSGSMGAPQGEEFGPKTKYAEAIKVLQEVLADLPKGTTISIWAFGQATGPAKATNDAESTIARIVAPVAWDPAKADELVAKVKYPALEPWNESPVLRSMFEAKKDFPAVAGYKTMVVLTDGADNRFANDKVINPDKKPLPDVLRNEFRNSGVTVHVVGFRLPEAEEAEVRKQFEVVTTLDPPGTFTPAADAEQLAKAIRTALVPTVRYWIEWPENIVIPGVPNGGLAVGTAGGGDRWFTPGMNAGPYKVRVLAAPYLVREIDLVPADRLLLEVTNGTGGLAVGRANWPATDYPTRPWSPARNWRLTLLQNQKVGSALVGLAAFSRTYEAAEKTVQLPHPRQVWFDVSPGGDNATPLALEWAMAPGYPADAWGIRVPGWPTRADGGPARPVVRTWLNPDQEPRVADRVFRGADFSAIADLANRKLSVDDDAVAIQNVAVEEHTVATSPGNREKQRCLVVRLTHGADNLVRVRIRGVDHKGSALWAYPAAGETTALFWPVSEKAADSLEAIELISVRAMKRTASTRGFAASLQDLGAPDPADERPRPPLPLP